MTVKFGRISHLCIGGVAIAMIASFMLAGCTSDPIVIDKNEEYTREFVKTFGVFDTQNDWNAAARVDVTVDAAIAACGTTCRVYTARPGTPGAMLVAEFPVSARTFSFDLAKAASHAYVEILDNKGKVVRAGACPLRASSVNVADALGAESVELCPTVIASSIKPNNVVSTDIRFASDNAKEIWRRLLGDERYNRAMLPDTDPDYEIVKANEVFKTYILGNKETTMTPPVSIDYLLPIVGPKDGKFSEGVCNQTKYRELLHPERGVEFVLEEAGPVSLDYFYGGTEYFNKLGYLYYKDGASLEDIMRVPRYILIDDARPHKNIWTGTSATEFGSKEMSGGMVPPTWIDFYEKGDNWMDKYFTGTKHRLVYFGDENEYEIGTAGSYIFPAGTHIVFFEIMNVGEDSENSDKPWRRNYSLPALNEFFNYTTTHGNNCFEQVTEFAANFATYQWHGSTIMGIEDGVDHDSNDMMFFVNGKIDDDEIVEVGGEKPEPQSWILAVEDLGVTDDFDFNDLVVKISHIAGSGELEIEPLAAGGTVPLQLFYADDNLDYILGYYHINEWFGESDYSVMVNTSGINLAAKSIKIDVPKDFTMSSEPLVVGEDMRMGGFHVRANHDGSGTQWTHGVLDIAAPAPGNVPQIICVPGNWEWPKERKNIRDAYPRIVNWVADRNVDADWYNYPADGLTVKRY